MREHCLELGLANRVGSMDLPMWSASSAVKPPRIKKKVEGGVFLTKQGKINFVDLAGSEMTKKTHSEGKTLEEANNINKSLMVLGYCIASLSDPKKKNSHIPYRDSKLTKLLADSLAGSGVTLMIACISPARSNLTETLNTLRYASRAKKIRNKPLIIMDPREALIMSLKREVSALQSENDHLRAALRLGTDVPITDLAAMNKSQIGAGKEIDIEEIANMEGSELAEFVRHYSKENSALRKENSELFAARDLLIRDQELVCRENERLLKKLEDVNSVCCRSPIVPARPSYSAELLSNSVTEDGVNIWRNPLNSSTGSLQNYSTSNNKIGSNEKLANHMSARLPDSIQKELDRRQIGKRGSSTGKMRIKDRKEIARVIHSSSQNLNLHPALNPKSSSVPPSFQASSNPADFFGDPLPEQNQLNKLISSPFGSIINLNEYDMLPLNN